MNTDFLLFFLMVGVLYLAGSIKQLRKILGSVRRRPLRRVKKRLEWWDF